MIELSQRAPVLLVVAVLLLVVGICAGEQTRLPQHLDSAEACCGFVQCSLLAIAGLAFALLGSGAFVTPATTFRVRSRVDDPLSPPPELIAFRSA